MKKLFKKTEHRIISLLLTAAILLSAVPVTVFAEKTPDDSVYATNGVTVSRIEDGDDAPALDEPATSGVTQEGTPLPPKAAVPLALGGRSGETRVLYFDTASSKFYASASYAAADSSIPGGVIDPANEVAVSGASWNGSTLTLNNVSWITSAPYALYINNGSAITLELEGSNTLISTNASTAPYHSAGVLSLNGMTIIGTGSLTATGGRVTDSDKGGAASRSTGVFNIYGALIVKNGVINATGGTGHISTGLFGGFGSLSLDGGVITATGTSGISESNGVSSDGGIVMNGGSLITKGGTASSGSSSGFFTWGGTINLNGGVFIASGNTQAIMLAAGGRMQFGASDYSWWHSTNQDGSNSVYDSGAFTNSSTYKHIRLDVAKANSAPPEITGLTVTDNGDGSVTVDFTSDKDGTVYYLVQDSGEPAPDKPNYSGDGWESLGNCNIDDNELTIDGLTPGDKDIYLVFADEDYNVSDPFKLTVEVTDGGGNPPDPTYDISLSDSGTYTFPSATYGYGAQAVRSVTVTNTGNQATGALTVALSGADSGSFTLSTASIPSVAVSGNDSFTVVPQTGLAVGTYTATVTVSGGNGISESFGVSFAVTKASVSNTGGTATVTYAGAMLDIANISGLFTVDANAGTRTYTVDGGTGTGTISGNILTVTKAGTFSIGLTTAETATHAAGGKVTATLTVNKGDQNAPAAPALTSKTDTSVTLAADSAMQFSKDGIAWQNGNVFTGLSPHTQYSFYQRLAETDLYKASGASPALSETTNKTVITSADVLVTAPVKGETPQSGVVSGTGYDGTITWNPDDTAFQGGVAYTATITLTAKSNAEFDDDFMLTVNGNTATELSADSTTVTYSYTFPELPARAVKSIDVITQPKLDYSTGDKLDLSALLVEVTYDDETTETIAYNNADLTYEIDSNAVISGTTAMSHAKHDGAVIVVSYDGKTADTSSLTVYSIPALQITVSDIASTSAKLTYSATGGSGNLTSKLQVKSGKTWTDVAGASSPHTASRLSPNTGYEYRIWVKDNTTNKEYTKSVTFRTAESASAGITVEGDVYDETSSHIFVTLEHGNTVISSTQAKAKSGVADTYTFRFTNVPDGIFNLVVDNGAWKVTQAVTVVNGVVTHPTGSILIDMSTGRTQSVVDIVTGDTPPAAVGGLPELFEDPAIYNNSDKDLVDNKNGTVEIKLAVEAKDSPADAGKIDNAATGQTVGLYLDLSVIKSRFDSDGALLDDTKLTDLGSNLITITFALPDALKGKRNLTIYRVHGGAVEALPFAPRKNGSGENADISGDLVTLKVCKFSTYAIAYTPDSISPPLSPPSGGGGGSGGSGGGGTASAISSTYWIEVAEAKTMVKSAKEQGADIARSRRAAVTGIRKASLLLLSESGLRYQHDTVANGAVQVRVYVDDPGTATKDILVSGYTTGDAVDKTNAIMKKWFGNRFSVISLDQQGDFGMKVRIAALVDLSGMDTSNLYFYSYDKASNKYKLFVTEYKLDSKGYLHFSTILAGNIIVSDRPLTQAGAEDAGFRQPLTEADLNNPNTGGDGNGMFIPPAKASPQDFASAVSIAEAETVDGVLKLESKPNPSAAAGNAAAKTDGVLRINLDTPDVTDIAQESGGFKLGAGGIAGIAIALFFIAMILWAVIPRKSDSQAMIRK